MKKKTIISILIILIILLIAFIFFFTIPSNYKNKIKSHYYNYSFFNSKNRIARILVFSDLHLYYDYQAKDLAKLNNIINDQQADIVIFNGDLIDNKSYKKDDKINNEIITKLKAIKPLFGKFVVYGDQDEKNKDSQDILYKADFENISNKIMNININNKTFNIIGLLNDPSILKQANDKMINLVFSHNPSIIDKVINNKIELIVTSHSLGGQYNLPFYGSIFNDIRELPYYKGTNTINKINIINSNGIGIYQSNMRFNAASSVEVIDIF